MRNIERFDLSRTEWERLIDDWIFNEGDRKIVKRRLLDGVTFENLAKEFDLSNQQVQKIIYKSQNKLLNKIK